jgi:hypothetical protein
MVMRPSLCMETMYTVFIIRLFNKGRTKACSIKNPQPPCHIYEPDNAGDPATRDLCPRLTTMPHQLDPGHHRVILLRSGSTYLIKHELPPPPSSYRRPIFRVKIHITLAINRYAATTSNNATTLHAFINTSLPLRSCCATPSRPAVFDAEETTPPQDPSS